MKGEKILTIWILTMALMLCPVSTAFGAVSLTVNNQDLTSIELELGQSCTVEVLSDDGVSYIAYLGFDNCVVLGDFLHLETKPEAGYLATAIEYEQPDFYGYYISASGFSPPPSAGVHFTFEYVALQLGETDLKLYDSAFTSVLDSVHITVIPLQPVAMGSAFTYQGRLSDTEGPAEGLYDFSFRLYDNPDLVFAAQQGPAVEIEDLDVIDGYFTVELDFGSSVFNGDARWLEIAVRPGEINDPNAFIALIPRQELTPTPYASYALQTRGIFVDDAENVGIGTTTPEAKLDVEVTSGPAATIGSSTNVAIDDYAVAMGANTTAGGHASTAMGFSTKALGSYSTAMGYGTSANGGYSTAIGYMTTASMDGSTAIGGKIEAAGNYSVAIGLDDTYRSVTQDNTMAILGGNVGIGTPSPSEKLDVNGTVKATAFLGDGSGLTDLPIGSDSDWTITISGSNMYSAVSGNVGIGTTTPSAKLDVEVSSGGAATIGGGLNSATGDFAVAMGLNTTASGFNSTAMGASTTASGSSSTAMGSHTTASGSSSIAMGRGIEAAGDYSVAIALADMEGAQITQNNTMAILGGNVGIGTTSPGAKLDVEVSSRGAATIGSNLNVATGDYAVATGYSTAASGSSSTAMGASTTASEDCSTAMGYMTTASGGGSTSMGANTTASGWASITMGSNTTASGYNSTAIGRGIEAAGQYSVAIALADMEGAQITQNNTMAIMGGNVGIGTASPGSYRLYVVGNAYSTGSWLGSDRQFKKNIETIDSAVDKITNIKGISFEWKTSEYQDHGFPEGRHYGVIAQEVEEVLPEIVKEGPDGTKAVSYTELIPILTEAIKEQQKQIENLQAEVKALQAIQQHQLTGEKEVQR